jgi:hypothetical protein
MERYINTTINVTSNQSSIITSYLGVKYPEIPYLDTDIYVYTTIGDRLDKLSQQYYGSTEYYWVIASANPDIGLNLSIRSTVWDTFEDDYLLVYSDSISLLSEGIENICTKYVDTINELKVDKIQSCLTSEKIANCKIFNDNVKLRFDSCSVCLEDTNKKTSCGHSLCIVCWSKIIGDIKCPICREEL